jgi:hypothetical protein
VFKVQRERCNQCLFSPDKIVSDKRRKQILRECAQTDTHFVCHKGTIAGVEVCCAGFHEAFPHVGNLHRIAGRMGWVELVRVE